MPRCKNCGLFGFFLKLTPQGLCSKCELIVEGIVTSCASTMKRSLDKLENTHDIIRRIQYCNTLFEHATRLQKYEDKGIPTIKPKPSVFIQECEKIKREIYKQSISQDKVC
ncbi:MAG: hypothetical protein PHN32_00325 [Actinomycetota bacterium]|nr:hypothetical protein [Actinomycetota bacterium]